MLVYAHMYMYLHIYMVYSYVHNIHVCTVEAVYTLEASVSTLAADHKLSTSLRHNGSKLFPIAWHRHSYCYWQTHILLLANTYVYVRIVHSVTAVRICRHNYC
jgi:hypothetical protein